MTDEASAPFDELRAALRDRSRRAEVDRGPGPTFRPDAHRGRRAGIPEVVFAERKRPEEVVAALRRLADATGRALASRCPAETVALVHERLGAGYEVTTHELASAVVVVAPGSVLVPTGGRLGVIAAGTSDLPIAAEAALMAREMGASVEEVWDVGVAGLHRLVAPLERMVAAGVDAIVVAAGMDGALPSVVAGLVAVPVIGLPTSVGYGFGGGGVGALTSMLQSCAPGLSVVNVDNGIGAGATAALIANRVAGARRAGARRDLAGGETGEEVGRGGAGERAPVGHVVDQAG